MEKLLDTLGIPKEPPKGSFYDLSGGNESDNKKPQDRSPGGQPGNQNARKHGLYSKHLPPEQLKQYNEARQIYDLSTEIAMVRLRINALLQDPEASQDTINKTLKVLGSLISIQLRYYIH